MMSDVSAFSVSARPGGPERADDGTGHDEQAGFDAALDETVTKLQAAARGHLERRTLSVTEPALGVTKVRIKGDREALARVGIENVDTTRGPKEVHYVRLDGDRFNAHVVHEEGPSADFEMPNGNRYQADLVATSLAAEGKTVAYINGPYYNRDRLVDISKSPHAPVGATRTHDGNELESVPPPRAYRNLYRSLEFENGSKYTSAPVLAKNGRPAFGDDRLEKPRFRYPSEAERQAKPALVAPGALTHAQHSNSRAAASIPMQPGPGSHYRLALAKSQNSDLRGPESTGMTMPEWSRAMARLSSLDRKPDGSPVDSIAINHDGGYTPVLGVMDEGGRTVVHVGELRAPLTSTLLGFSPSERPERPDVSKVETNGARILRVARSAGSSVASTLGQAARFRRSDAPAGRRED